MQLFEAYLLTSVARESVRRRRRNQRIPYMDPADIERFSATVSMNLDRQLDDAKRIEVFRACMDEQGRMMYDLRVLDYDWRAAPATPIQTLTHDDLFRLYEAQQEQQRPPQPVLKKEIHHDVTRNDTGLESGR